MPNTRGVRKINENILSNGRALIITEKDKSKYNWSDIPVGSKFIDVKTGVELVKLEGETDWVPSGIKNDGTISIAKDSRILVEIFTIVSLDDGDGTFTYKNSDGEIRHMPIIENGAHVFELEIGSYQPQRNHLDIMIDDVLARSASTGGVTELTDLRFALTEELYVGQEITARYLDTMRIGNPYPRVFIANEEPAKSEIGDLWIDEDGTLDDADALSDNLEVTKTISWERITGKPTTVDGYGIRDNISYVGHTHSKSDILNFPNTMPAKGGDADTVGHHAVGFSAGNIPFLDANGKLPHSVLLPQYEPGMIMMWYGSANMVPEGWRICNGSNGTPDLTDRFIVGAGGKYTVGNKGGESEHTISIDEMPSHGHQVTAGVNDVVGSFRTWKCDPQASGAFTQTNVGAICNSRNSGADPGWRVDLHVDKFFNNITFDKTGKGQAHNNLPPYYALFYIMKV